MGLEAFLDHNSQSPIPLTLPYSGALTSHSSLDMAQPNANLAYNVLNSSFPGNSSLPRNMDHNSFYNTNLDPYMSLPSSAVSVSGNNPMVDIRQTETNREGPKGPRKTNSPACRPDKTKKDLSRITASLKKPRVEDINRESVPKQEVIEKLLMKELQERNSMLMAMAEKYGVQNQLQKPTFYLDPHQLRGFNLQQLPKEVVRSAFQEQGNLQAACVPLLDASICSRRLKQYLFHLRNNTPDNGIAYWKKFVSEYYARGSKKRWCFCKYENIQLQSTGVFYPKSMEVWSCDLCGSRSGKGLEANFDIFPRLLMTKFESGMMDEILFLDSPRSCNVPCGLVLDYGKAILESVYENIRVVHEGRLRIVFRYDLKILSWEFCAQNHEEFLPRSLIIPQVNQLVQASKTFQNHEFSRVSLEDLRTLCDAVVSAGEQLVRNIETPLVNDLGYPKRFIRCLQIAEVADSMKDVMALSLQTNMGPIECWESISSQVSSTRNNQTKEKQEMEIFSGPQSPYTDQPGMGCHGSFHQMFENSGMSGSGSLGLSSGNLNPSTATMRREGQDLGLLGHSNRPTGSTHFCPPKEAHLYSPLTSQSFVHGGDPRQASVDKLLREMVSAGMGRSLNENYDSAPISGTRNEMTRGESSISASVQSNSVTTATRSGFSKAVSHGNSVAVGVSRSITVKAEQCSPEQVPEAYQSSASGFAKIEDMSW